MFLLSTATTAILLPDRQWYSVAPDTLKIDTTPIYWKLSEEVTFETVDGQGVRCVAHAILAERFEAPPVASTGWRSDLTR